MRFQKQCVDARCHRGTGQRSHHGAVAAGDTTRSTRLLHAVRGIKHHRNAQLPHGDQAREIIDESAIAKERTPLGQQNVLAPGAAQLVHDELHVLGAP